MKKSIIEINSLSFSYRESEILENISLRIEEKDFIALIGPNGSGKTTLIKIILGLLEPNKGEIDLKIKKEEIGYVPQYHEIDPNFPGTVKEILSKKNKEIIEQTGIEDLMEKKFVNLSGGQQQKVLIALALEQNPKLLILDEPTSGIDSRSEQSFYELLKKLNKKGVTIILVTHEIGMVHSLVKDVICINHRICCTGKTAELPQLLKKAYGSDFIQHHHHGGHHD